MNNKMGVITYILVAVLVIGTLGATYAYFQAKVGSGSSTSTTVNAKTIDGLTFNSGTNISITATQTNFANGKGNLSSSTSPTVTLKARNDAAANYNYKACLNITSNNFEYTTTRKSINLFDISKVLTSPTVKNNNDGTLSITRTDSSSSVAANTTRTLATYCPECKAGTTYTLSATTEANRNTIYLQGSNFTWTFGQSRTLTAADLTSDVLFYGSSPYDGKTIKISNIQIEEGSVASDYESYGLVDAAELELSVTKNNVVVFKKDITKKTGEICIPTTNGGSTTTHTISAAAGATTTDTWNATVTFKNYNNNQNINLDKTFNSNFVFTRI